MFTSISTFILHLHFTGRSVAKQNKRQKLATLFKAKQCVQLIYLFFLFLKLFPQLQHAGWNHWDLLQLSLLCSLKPSYLIPLKNFTFIYFLIWERSLHNLSNIHDLSFVSFQRHKKPQPNKFILSFWITLLHLNLSWILLITLWT